MSDMYISDLPQLTPEEEAAENKWTDTWRKVHLAILDVDLYQDGVDKWQVHPCSAWDVGDKIATILKEAGYLNV